MTGLWQVLGASDIPFDEMTKLDYLYVTNWSLLREDLRLILLTLPALAPGHEPRTNALVPAQTQPVPTDRTARADGRPTCRFCAAPLELTVVDLGMSSPCESFLTADADPPDGTVLPAPRARL